MARIAGVNIPTQKRLKVALTYIYGIGHTRSVKLIERAGVDATKRVKDLSNEEVNRLRDIIDSDEEPVEGDLRRIEAMNIKRLQDMKCFRGLRHRMRLPVRGQRTQKNCRTRKGKAVPVAGKKKAVK